MRFSLSFPLSLERFLVGVCLAFALLQAGARSAAGQIITVENGATVEMDNGGVWDLRGSTVDLGGTGSTASIAELGGRFANGTLTATRSLNAPSQADPGRLGAKISSSASLGATTVTRGHAAQTGNSNASIRRYYDLSATTNTGLDATLTFTYRDAELNGLSEGSLVLFRSTDGGATWSEEGQDGRDATANTVTLSGIDALSRWTLGSASSPLPVELARFDAQTDAEAVVLRWKTASETNNAGFEVQRTTAVKSWTTIGFQEGAGTTTDSHTYRFRDTDVPYEADSVTYRLRQVDTDGTAHLSSPVTVARAEPERVRLRTVYPNPARQTTTIRYEVPKATDVRLRLFDVLGRRVATLHRGSADAGRHTVQPDLSGLAAGTYLIRLAAADQRQTQRLVVVR